MKIKICILLFLCIGSAYSSCEKTIDSDEVIVFIDTNYVLGEVESARKAACEQGKNFKVLPYGYEAHKKIGLLREKEYRIYAKGQNLARKDKFCFTYTTNEDEQTGEGENKYSDNSKECTDYRASLEEAKTQLKLAKNKEFLKLVQNQDPLIQKEFKENAIRYGLDINALEEEDDLGILMISEKYGFTKEKMENEFQSIASGDLKLKSIIASGHDGGGSIHGSNSGFNKYEIVKWLENNFSDDQLENLESILLWGCYTTNRKEVNWWSEKLPSLKVLAGFLGSGPSIGKEASGRIMYDILASTEDLFLLQDSKEIERALKSLDGMVYMNGGVMLNSCNGESWYYGRNYNNSERIWAQDFGKSGTQRCLDEKLIAETNENIKKYEKYFNGDIPIPKNTHSGPLRQLYNVIRNYEDCSTMWEGKVAIPNGDTTGLLLFYDGVKANFFNEFAPIITEFKKTMNELLRNETNFIANELGIERVPPALPLSFDEVAKAFEKRKGGYFEYFEKLMSMKSKYGKLLTDPPSTKEDFLRMSRKDIVDFAKMLNEMNGSLIIRNEYLKKKISQEKPSYNKEEQDRKDNQGRRNSQLRGLLNNDQLPSNNSQNLLQRKFPKVELKKDVLNSYSTAVNQYLYQLDPFCMNFLTWHEDRGSTSSSFNYLGRSMYSCDISRNIDGREI